MRILIIEDEPRMSQLLCKGLYENGFTVMTATDGAMGLEMAMVHDLDAIVLDIGLPQLDGYGLLQILRTQKRLTPVLILTARDTEDDIIKGLDLGADDYLTKPFSFSELVARLQSITRRARAKASSTIEVGNVVLDPILREVTVSGENIDLTRLEFLLLECLVRRTGQCVPRQELIEFVWGAEHEVGPTALDVLVNSLRSKIDAPFRRKFISTVRGSGYIFKLNTTGNES